MRQPPPRAGPLGRLFAWLGGALFAASLLYFLYAYFVRFGRGVETGDAVRALAVNTALFGAFALHHSVFARAPAKRAAERRVGPPLERPLYVWISSLLFLLCCMAWQDVPGLVYRVPGALHPLGWLVQAAGVWLTLRAARRLDVLDLSGIRQAAGERPALPLQFRGAYALVRHPIYLAWALIVFGAPHMTATRFSFAALSTLYLIVAIPLEERSLVREFGGAYRDYQRRVRWRMIPGVY